MAFFKIVTFCAVLAVVSCSHYPPGYSYAKFSGPVSGPEHEVIVPDKHGKGHSIDYVAKPDYHFAYGVEDPKTKVSQNRKETRHGDEVHGEYSVVNPDGKLMVVKYSADKHNGFQAEVITDGKSADHGHGHAAAPAHLEAEPAHDYHSGEYHGESDEY